MGEYLQKAAVTEEDKVACAGYIMSECRRLSNLSRQLLELAALRGEDIAWEPVSVERLMETVEYTVRAKAEKRGNNRGLSGRTGCAEGKSGIVGKPPYQFD